MASSLLIIWVTDPVTGLRRPLDILANIGSGGGSVSGGAGLPVGTTAGTVAAGDDSRIVHAIQDTSLGQAGGVAQLDGTGRITGTEERASTLHDAGAAAAGGSLPRSWNFRGADGTAATPAQAAALLAPLIAVFTGVTASPAAIVAATT